MLRPGALTLTDADPPGGTTDPAAAPPDARAFVAFAGGGAKGLAHVGALRALEQQPVRIVGYAGTSAGAIVAALAAAGLTSDDMVGSEGARTLIDEIHKVSPRIARLTDLFGRGGWLAIAALRGAADLIDRMPPVVRWLLAIGASIVTAVVTIGAEALFGFGGAYVILVLWVAVIAAAFQLAAGLARLDTLRETLSRFLKNRVFGDPDAAGEVLMSHFDGVERPLLKIVASDITHKRLQLFACDTRIGDRLDETPGATPVADAVCASICLPLIFVPWRIGGVRYVDGGVVSNFPAWPFDEERSLDPDAYTIGFQIGEPEGAPAPPDGTGRPVFWPPAVIQTALFGSSQLSVRAVGRAELITLRPTLKLLDFDLSPERAWREVDDICKVALTAVNDRLFRFPAVYRDACAQVRAEVAESFAEDASAIFVDPGQRGRVRCAVAMPHPAEFSHSLATLYGDGYDDDADGDLLWPMGASLAGAAWTYEAPQFELAPTLWERELVRPQDRGLRRRLPHDLAWSLRVPISTTAGKPFLVVLLDGSDALQDNDLTTGVIEALIDRTQAIFRPVVTQFEETAAHG